MNNKESQLHFLLAGLLGTFVLAFFIFRPFLYALILAVVFAVSFNPLLKKIKKIVGAREGLSALLTLLFVVVFIFTPILFLGTQIFNEAQQVYFSIKDNGGGQSIEFFLDNITSDLQIYFPGIKEFSLDINSYFQQGLDWLIHHLGDIFGSFAKIALGSFIFLVSLYSLLKDGGKLKKFLVELSPLNDTEDEIIANKLGLAINSVVRGNLIIALVQGGLTATGLMLFNVPNAALWGSVAAITALIPGIGTAIVLAPAILFTFFTSGTLYGFGLLAWGVGAVGLVDNFLGPRLVGKGMQLHPLVVLLSVLGGMAFFGPIGFLLGPLTVSLFLAFFSAYMTLVKNK